MVSLYTFRIRSLIGVIFMSRPQNESVLSQVPEMSQFLMTPLWFLSLWVSVHSLVWLKIRDQLWEPALPIESQLSTALSHQFNSDNWIDQLAGVAYAICVGSVEYNIYKCQRMGNKNYAGLSMGCVMNHPYPILLLHSFPLLLDILTRQPYLMTTSTRQVTLRLLGFINQFRLIDWDSDSGLLNHCDPSSAMIIGFLYRWSLGACVYDPRSLEYS